MYHFSIFQDMANRLITIICFLAFFKIRQIDLSYILSNFFFVDPLTLSKISPDTDETSALPELPIFSFIYLTFPSLFYQFWSKC